MLCARTPVSKICFDVSASPNELASATGESESRPNLSAQTLQVKSRRPLFRMNLADTPAPLFEVSADGQRVLAVMPARAESSSISLLLNWRALLHK
jgi:hypothetical protein